MAAIRGRRQRPASQTTTIYARVRPENRDKAQEAAAALNISLAAYIDLLIERASVEPVDLPAWASDTFKELRDTA